MELPQFASKSYQSHNSWLANAGGMLVGGLVGNAIAGPIGGTIGGFVGNACAGYICTPKKPVISPSLEHAVKAREHSMHHYMPHQIDPSETQGFHYSAPNNMVCWEFELICESTATGREP